MSNKQGKGKPSPQGGKNKAQVDSRAQNPFAALNALNLGGSKAEPTATPAPSPSASKSSSKIPPSPAPKSPAANQGSANKQPRNRQQPKQVLPAGSGFGALNSLQFSQSGSPAQSAFRPATQKTAPQKTAAQVRPSQPEQARPSQAAAPRPSAAPTQAIKPQAGKQAHTKPAAKARPAATFSSFESLQFSSPASPKPEQARPSQAAAPRPSAAPTEAIKPQASKQAHTKPAAKARPAATFSSFETLQLPRNSSAAKAEQMRPAQTTQREPQAQRFPAPHPRTAQPEQTAAKDTRPSPRRSEEATATRNSQNIKPQQSGNRQPQNSQQPQSDSGEPTKPGRAPESNPLLETQNREQHKQQSPRHEQADKRAKRSDSSDKRTSQTGRAASPSSKASAAPAISAPISPASSRPATPSSSAPAPSFGSPFGGAFGNPVSALDALQVGGSSSPVLSLQPLDLAVQASERRSTPRPAGRSSEAKQSSKSPHQLAEVEHEARTIEPKKRLQKRRLKTVKVLPPNPEKREFKYPELPISQHRDEIKAAIAANQVVIVVGETGSGKTTQLPKMALEIAEGKAGRLGCTQPRRLAAVAVARRIAEEVECELGQYVGYQVRFDDHTNEETRLKLMTDGILLAETQEDPDLLQYHSIILDEAHERSLNIDFLLGYMKMLLERRKDLKLIISSATMDAAAFSEFFTDAPIIYAEGRSFPVEMNYMPARNEDEELSTHVCRAVEWLSSYDIGGDALIFLPGEREINECTDALQALNLPSTDILPLFARLGLGEQQRIFKPQGNRRRIVLATNVAETSLTIPGIIYVIDSGLARISRYLPGQQVQRLHIEDISQASARQRAGRCGRVCNGICVRLYSEEDFNERPAFTDPEIRRSALAGVILRMADLQLPELSKFPLPDPPSARLINEGYHCLREIGALDRNKELTEIGSQLARLPLDPRHGRMLLAARQEQVLPEMLIIVAGMSIMDPRERPSECAAQADQAQAQWRNEESDFLSQLALWRSSLEWKEDKGRWKRNQLRKWCQKHYLNYQRILEWHNLVQDLSRALKQSLRWNIDPLPEEIILDKDSKASIAQRPEAKNIIPEGKNKMLTAKGKSTTTIISKRGRENKKPRQEKADKPELSEVAPPAPSLQARQSRRLGKNHIRANIAQADSSPAKDDKANANKAKADANKESKTNAPKTNAPKTNAPKTDASSSSSEQAKRAKAIKPPALQASQSRNLGDNSIRTIKTHTSSSQEDAGKATQSKVNSIHAKPKGNAALADAAKATQSKVNSIHAKAKQTSKTLQSSTATASTAPASRRRESALPQRKITSIPKLSPQQLAKKVADINAKIHRSILAGAPLHIGYWRPEDKIYRGTSAREFSIFPGSGVFKRRKRPEWIMGSELVETTRLWMRRCAVLDPAWIEEAAPQLCAYHAYDPHWDAGAGQVFAKQRVSIGGLCIVESRRISYASISPAGARELLIRDGIMEQNIRPHAPFLQQLDDMREEIRKSEGKLRRRDLLWSIEGVYSFFDNQLPADIISAKALRVWREKVEKSNPEILFIRKEDCSYPGENEAEEALYPDSILDPKSGERHTLYYNHDPGAADDGVCIGMHIDQLAQFSDWLIGWQIPAHLPHRAESLLRSLPKNIRAFLHPIASSAEDFAAAWQGKAPDRSLEQALAEFVIKRSGGQRFCAAAQFEGSPHFAEKLLPEYVTKVWITDDEGKELALGHDIAALRKRLSSYQDERIEQKAQQARHQFSSNPMTRWDCGELPYEIPLAKLKGYPALIDASPRAVRVEIFPKEDEAQRAHRGGLLRLAHLRHGDFINHFRKSQKLPILSMEDRLALSTLGADPKQNIEELLHVALEGAMFGGSIANAPLKLPRNAQEFEQSCDKLQHNLFDILKGPIALLWNRLVESEQALRLYQISAGQDRYASRIAADLTRQWQWLTRPHFLSSIGYERLNDLNRYLRGIQERLKRISEQPAIRELERIEQLHEAIGDYYELPEVAAQMQAQSKKALRMPLLHYGILIEEYRLSLFAPNLVLKGRSSAKKLQEAADELIS